MIQIIKRNYMVREIIKPVSEIYNLHIPKEYINKRVEILILPFSYNEKNEVMEQNDDVLKKTSGILKNTNIDPLKWQEEIRDEWNK
jgi:putative transposon-encoded protein